MPSRHLPFLLLSLLGLSSCLDRSGTATTSSGRDWPEYLGGPDRNHYSTLSQINLSNVGQLQKAWEYHTQDSGQIQCNPITVNGILFGMTANTQPFALDAATGREIWRRPMEESSSRFVSRGLVYWESGEERRILFTNDSWLYALDARTGELIPSFGEQGRTSLRTGLGASSQQKRAVSTTPGTVFEDLIIMPLTSTEGPDAALGHIQAFNIRTGELAWVFKTIPEPGEYGYDTWPPEVYKNTEVGAANNWAGMAIDRPRGIVYVPTGSAAFDYYGGNRKGSNLFANTLLALDARTGKRLWHFQIVHHDIFDYDLPAPPNLVTLTHQGKRVEAVAQVTKHGYVFVFDRVTGEPLFPIEEVPVPASDVPGEEAWPTQPIPAKPAPYARHTLTEAEISPYAPNREELLQTFRDSRFEGSFTPLSKRGSIVFPGLDGGAEWGGAAVDPDGIMYLNSSEMAWILALGETKPVEQAVHVSLGQRLYAANCSACHGSERQGNAASGFPSLVNVSNSWQREHVVEVITKGKGKMPSFMQLTEQEKQALVAFLFGDPVLGAEVVKPKEQEPAVQKPQLPYRISRLTKFLDKDGNPAISPPWGTLNAIDLNTGEYVWKTVFGEYPELMAKGIPQTGSESYGGPVVTAGGLLFIAGTKDRKFRAYDKKTGKVVWETLLPAAGFATPSTYEVNGKQYVVVACGGGKLGAAKGESYVAFALP
jgi:quinoprotein glucose dehydrogenase